MARAYKELEAAGVVATTAGTAPWSARGTSAWSALSAAAAEFAAAAKAQGASFAEAVQLLAAAYDRRIAHRGAERRANGYSKKFSISISACLKP